MKKNFFIHVIICIYAILNINKASCQNTVSIESLPIRTEGLATPGQNTALPANTSKDYRNAINIKAVRNFINDFTNVKNVTWSRTNEGSFAARFMSDSIQTIVTYNSNGSRNYTLKTYAESKMPDAMRTMVKRAYSDYAITEIKEINFQQKRGDIIYNVLIRYADNFKILQIRNWEIEIINDYYTAIK